MKSRIAQHVQEVCNLNQMSKVAKLASNGTHSTRYTKCEKPRQHANVWKLVFKKIQDEIKIKAKII